MFTHLHGHSHYSILNGLGTPKDIIKKVKELGMDSITLTEYGAMYSAVEFYEDAKKEEIKPILGVELSIVENMEKMEKNEPQNQIVLLSKTYEGYENLLKLTSKANLDGFNERPRIDFNKLKEYGNGIIVFMGGTNSQIGNMISKNESKEKIKEKIHLYKELLGENFFMEITAVNHQNDKETEKINNTIFELAGETETKLIVNNNFHYINKDDQEAYEVLLCIKNGKKFAEEDREKLKNSLHIFSEEEIRETLENNNFKKETIDQLIQNNEDIKNSINVELPIGRILFPKYESPDYIKEIYEKNKDNIVTE